MRHIITAALLVLSMACGADPTEVAHRGDPYVFHENTLHSIKSGASKADMVEVDVRWTRTDVPVLMHDKTLDRTTTGTGRVADRTWRYLKNHPVDAGLPESSDTAIRKVPLVRWACRQTTKPLLLDIKVRHAMAHLMSIVKEDCPPGTMIMLSGGAKDWQWRAVSRAGLPGVVLVRSADQPLYQAEYGAVAAHVRRDLLTDQMKQRVRDAELQLWSWSYPYEDPDTWLTPDIQGYTTNTP